MRRWPRSAAPVCLRVAGVLGAWGLLVVGVQAQAAAPDPHAAQPERPSVATHAGTVARGWLEVEAGVERDRDSAGAVSWQTGPVAKVGLASNVQLSVTVPIVGESGAWGPGDVTAGVKWRLRDAVPGLGAVAVLPSLTLPTGASGLGTGTTDVSVLFISSHRFGDVSMDINGGYTRRSGDGTSGPRDATLWAVAFGGTAHGRLGWGGEVFGYPRTTGPAGAASSAAVLLGPTLAWRPWLVFDLALVTPVTGPQPRALIGGLVYNVGRLRGRP